MMNCCCVPKKLYFYFIVMTGQIIFKKNCSSINISGQSIY